MGNMDFVIVSISKLKARNWWRVVKFVRSLCHYIIKCIFTPTSNFVQPDYLKILINMSCRGRAEGEEHQTQALVFLFSRVWVRVPILMHMPNIRKTLKLYCYVLHSGGI